MNSVTAEGPEGIAIIGMAGRFPKAATVDEFWRNLCQGSEAISFFSDEELAQAGIAVPKNKPNYVKARGVLEGADLFDAAFFGIKPKEAEVMDPQHRIFLECAWEALETAGWDPERFDGLIGVFAGMSMNTYAAHNLMPHADLVELVGEYQLMLGNDKDFLPTRVSYKLNLKGPSLNIQTACSTSLVAVCDACHHLLSYQCDMALAGAVSISFPQKKGHYYQQGGIISPDGHCRAFDAKAAGTVAGEGVGIVVLKRLQDARADGDQVLAVIKGFALNNDGSLKVGYTAPSVEGQADVIAMAQAMAGVPADSISYIEAHGTGTPLGDPIEIEGLTKAFRASTSRKQFCAIGSVKSNIGHLDTAAGVAGLIKTTLALRHRLLPPTLHFAEPNPSIDFANSPFTVNKSLTPWTNNGTMPRRAGVSSFGIGGTNAHVVLEEAPALEPTNKGRPAQLLVLSAKSATALEQATTNLREHLRVHREIDLADTAYTLQVGRRRFTHRRMLVCRSVEDADGILGKVEPKGGVITHAQENESPVMFLFPGQGSQHINMGFELYKGERTFREQIDCCSELLQPQLGLDLRTVLYPKPGDEPAATQQLLQTAITQPALFVIEYALARLWMAWGIEPVAMLGHSIGEYVAASIAGVFSIEDTLKLVAERGRMMQRLPEGTMLAVRLPEREVKPLLNDNVSLAAINGAALCVVSGPAEAVEEVRADLDKRGVACKPLHTSHAFHSRMMEPALKPFAELVRSLPRKPPAIPFISNVTGVWITAEQATDPDYWASHLRQTVRFADGLAELFKRPDSVLLEVGPGHTLSNLARQHPAKNPQTLAVSSLPASNESSSDLESVLSALGQLWLRGANVNWCQFYDGERRRRIALPTYPFERKRYWVEPLRAQNAPVAPPILPGASSEGNGHGKQIVAESAGANLVVARPGNGATRTRKEQIALEVRALLSDLSGLDLAKMEGSTTFTEMGFESLFLTQATLAIERKMGVNIPFRELFEEANSLDGLVAFIDRSLPREAIVGDKSQTPEKQADRPLLRTMQSARPRKEAVSIDLNEHLPELQRRENELKQAGVKLIAPEVEKDLNELCSAYVCDYFKSSQIALRAGKIFSKTELRSALRLRPVYDKFFQFMLNMLAEDEVIRLHEDEVEVLRNADVLPEPTALHGRLFDQLPEFRGLLEMLKHCASHYRPVLAGELLGTLVLLPNGRHDFLNRHLQGYSEFKGLGTYKELAKGLVMKLARETSLSILEVGAGGGELTWQLVPELGGTGCEYHFSDIARTFVQEAQKAAAQRGFDWMNFGVLDISKDPVAQGYVPNSYDLVLGLNVVHATPRVGETLAQLKKLIVPGGLICLVELTKYWRWDHLIIGLARDWWAFEDEFRKDSPLMELAQWEEVFNQQGFEMVSALPVEPFDRQRSDAGLIVGQWQPQVHLTGKAGKSRALQDSAESNGHGRSELFPADKHAAATNHARELGLTLPQAEVWYATQLGDDASCAYNDSRLLHFRGEMRVSELARALQQLVERHEALRTVFSPRGDFQRILPELKLKIPLVDLTGLDDAAGQARLEALEADEASRPFDLVHGPLARAQLVKVTDQHHVLVLTIHHLVCDGHSWAVLLGDLSQLYNAAIAGVPPRLEPALQLTEFVSGQGLRRAGGDPAEDFWVNTFSDGGAILELPTDHARPAQWTFDGARECCSVDARLSGELHRLSVKYDCTLFTTLLAVQYLLLHRLSGQEDLAVGIPAADRSSKEAATLIAHTVNFLPVRLRVAGDPEFAEFLAAVKNTFLEAYEHRGYSLGSLIQKLNIPRDLSRMPLVSVVFNVDRMPAAAQFTGLETDVVLNSRSFCSFDLMFNITETSEGQAARALPGRGQADQSKVGLRLDCRYNRNLFARETIQRWLGHFQALLEGVVASPHQKISELSLLSADERQRVLVEWNATDAPYPQDRCVHQLFEEQVERAPHATALMFRGQSLTYAQLNQEANELASRLQGLGVGPDVPVGVCIERSLEMIVAVLAVLKAGGAYLPLDPGYPSERIALMVENARTPLILTQANLAADLARFKARVVPVTAVKQTRSAKSSALRQPSSVTSSNLAYVIYTSGSTGIPKGVAVTHQNSVNFIHWAKQQFTKDELAGVLFSTSLCFDLSVFELFVTLSSGGRVILVQNALELAQLAERDQVTLINTVPSAATELLRIGGIPPSTRVMNLGGEPLKAELADRLYAVRTIEKVYDLYGPSETTTYSTCALRRPGGPQTVGRPIANTQIYVLDAHRQVVPVGVVGEVYIGGEGVTRGYLHQPDVTTENFIDHSLGALGSRRLYKTGDLGRWSPEGELELLGRNDSQVKIRGFRVEPGEIEATLLRHAMVAEAVVVPRDEQTGGGRVLVAYMVANGGPNAAKFNDEELRKFLESKLPLYMVPSHFVQLDKMPLTPNGKVNRRALPKPGPITNAREFVLPRNPVERTLAEIWSEVLGQKAISVRDNFFALGGHSLLAIQIIWRIAKVFPVELTIRAIFESPTIESLAECVANAPRSNKVGESTITKHISPLEAEQLLNRLDSLSDAEVEKLLGAVPPSADNHGG